MQFGDTSAVDAVERIRIMKAQCTAMRNGWSIVLAGGEGKRVKPLVLRWLGRHRPKQYCAFVGSRSMFQYTVDRTMKLTPQEQTVTIDL